MQQHDTVLPLWLNFSSYSYSTTKHYQKFRPQKLGTISIHSHGFTPFVYKHSEHKPNSKNKIKYGHRSKHNIIGLTNIGYIDIDLPTIHSNLLAEHLGTNKAYIDPTATLLHKALSGLWHYCHPSASRIPGKYRVLYKRPFIIYQKGAYNIATNTWELDLDNANIQPVYYICNGEQEQELDLDNANIQSVLTNILSMEAQYVADLLSSAGINYTGIDLTAIRPHMHSSHITNKGDSILKETIHPGKAIDVLAITSIADGNSTADGNSIKNEVKAIDITDEDVIS